MAVIFMARSLLVVSEFQLVEGGIETYIANSCGLSKAPPWPNDGRLIL
jgi:hypothetical protein